VKGPDTLTAHRGRLRTRVGAFVPGQRAVFRGADLHADLKEIDWIDLYTFGITGRRHTPAQLKLLHAIWTYTSYPDARLWNNRVAGLAGTARSTASLGVGAAIAVSEASIYGGGIVVRAIDFLIRTRRARDNGVTLDECVETQIREQRVVPGYGRPITAGDERIAPIMVLARSLGADQGTHVRLAFEIDGVLLKARRRLRINYAAVVAALGADMGFSADEFSKFMILVFVAGMLPCFGEARERPEGTLFPLSCADVQYEGSSKRKWNAR
jgi:hypothetical protein